MTRRTANTFFSPVERELIRQAIVRAEAGTSGEIVPLVVDRSDDYRDAVLAASVVLAGLLALLLMIALHHDSIWWFIPLLVLLVFPCRYMVQRKPFLVLPFVSKKRIEQVVCDRALRSFYSAGLHRTRRETGVLIYLSLFEHKVWILGDRGIHERIGQDQWQGMIDQLVTGIRQGTATAALCKVIADCGTLLRIHFPETGDAINELQDEVLTL